MTGFGRIREDLNEPEPDIKVADLGSLASGLTKAAVGLGIAAILVLVFTKELGFAVFLGLLCFLASVGAAAFTGLGRTAAETASTVDGKRVLAQGVGRGGKGFLGGQVVLATDSGIAAVAAWPWGAGATQMLRYSDVERLETGELSLSIDGPRARLRLKKCSPLQIIDLEAEIRQRMRGGQGQTYPESTMSEGQDCH